MIFMIIPMVAIGINHHKTVEGRHFMVQYSPTFRFTFFGCIAFNALILLGAALSLFRFGGVAQFTHAESAFQMLGLYGFFTMIMFGAMYFIMPRLMGCEWCSSRMIRFHFWFSAYGTCAMIMVLFVGGIFQGVEQMRFEDPFVLSAEVSRGFMVGRTLAWIFILMANSVFFLHMLLMICRLGRRSKDATLIHPLSE